MTTDKAQFQEWYEDSAGVYHWVTPRVRVRILFEETYDAEVYAETREIISREPYFHWSTSLKTSGQEDTLEEAKAALASVRAWVEGVISELEGATS